LHARIAEARRRRARQAREAAASLAWRAAVSRFRGYELYSAALRPAEPKKAAERQWATLTNVSPEIRRELYQQTNGLLVRCTSIDSVQPCGT
jgi:hypothetical protein